MLENKLDRRQFLAGVAATTGMAVMSILAGGCAPKGTPAPAATAKPEVKPTEASPKAQKEPILIRFANQGGAFGDLYVKYAQAYDDEHPEIKVESEDVPYGEMGAKAALQLAAGTLQDILYAHNRWHKLGCASGWYVPIDDLLESVPDAIPDYDDFYAIGVEHAKFEGKTYGIMDFCVPGCAHMLTWNRGLFEKAGLEPPNADMSMDELRDLAIKMAKPDEGIFGITCVLHKQNRLMSITRCYGKPEYGVDGDTSGWLHSPDGKTWRFIEATEEWYKNFYKPCSEAHAIVGPQDEVDWWGGGGLFSTGQCAMLQGYHRDPVKQITQVGDKWDYHPEDCCWWPKGPQGRFGTCHEYMVFMVGALCKHQEEALRVIGALTGYDIGLEQIAISGAYSARSSCYRDSPIAQEIPIFKDTDELMRSDIVEPYSLPWNFRDSEALDAYINTSTPLWNGTATWEEQAPIVQQEVQKVYDEPRP